MTTSVIVKAHCGTEKEVVLSTTGELDIILQDGQVAEVVVYGDRSATVQERLKVVPAADGAQVQSAEEDTTAA